MLLLDARKGALTQTRRHAYIVSLLGVRHVAFAINKLDLVDYSQSRFEELGVECRDLADQVGLPDVSCIPIAALHGDNIVARSARTPWYEGPTLLAYLENVMVDEDRLQVEPFRLPVQWVNRPNHSFRGFSGMVASGTVAPGDKIIALPSRKQSTVERVATYDGDLERAVAGESVTLTLTDEIDISRGEVIADLDQPPGVADQFEATLVWMAEDPLLRGRNYLMRIGTSTVGATVAPLKYRIDVHTLKRIAADKLELNEIGVGELELDRPISFDPYTQNRDMGGFVLIDRITSQTVGAGMLNFELRRSHSVQWQSIDVDKSAHVKLKGHRPCVLWMTGLSGAGKSTIANLVERKLHSLGCHTYLLDGDNVRHGLCKDLGFTDADRVENIRRVAEVAGLMVDAGLIVITSFISPFRSERRTARELLDEGEFIEVFVDAPLKVAEARDPKNLYAKARRGELANFTGIDSPYEPPEAPDMHIDTTVLTAEQAAEQLVAELRRRNVLDPE